MDQAKVFVFVFYLWGGGGGGRGSSETLKLNYTLAALFYSFPARSSGTMTSQNGGSFTYTIMDPDPYPGTWLCPENGYSSHLGTGVYPPPPPFVCCVTRDKLALVN